MNTPKDITELRNQLLDQYAMVAEDPRRIPQAVEAANIAGKVISTVALQLAYAAQLGQEVDIPFMGEPSGKLLPTSVRKLTKTAG